MNCPKCHGEIPAENVERGEGKRRASCPTCGTVVTKTTVRAGYGRRPMYDVESGGLDVPYDGESPGRDPMRDPMRLLSR